MKKKSLFIVLLAFPISMFSQTKEKGTYNVNQLQGVWQFYFNYTYPNSPGEDKIFFIYKGRERLQVYTEDGPYDKLSVAISEYGFSDSSDRDSIYAMEQLSDTGTYYVEFDENVDFHDCLINVSDNFVVKERIYLNVFRDECRYIDKVPKEVLDVLYKRGKHDKRDYAKEFLDLQIYGIQVDKSMIYDTTQNKTKMYLVKDDVVIVTGEDKRFLKIEYETSKGDIIKGYIKKEDAVGIQTD